MNGFTRKATGPCAVYADDFKLKLGYLQSKATERTKIVYKLQTDVTSFADVIRSWNLKLNPYACVKKRLRIEIQIKKWLKSR